MYAISYATGRLLSNSFTLFLLTVLLSENSFQYLKKMVREIQITSKLPPFIFSICNGVLVVVLERLITSPRPIMTMITVPLLITVEMVFIAKDEKRIYIHMFSILMIHFICFYCLSVAICGLVPAIAFSTDIRGYRIILLSITLILVSIALFYLAESKRFSHRELYVLFHSKEMGRLLILYFAISNIVLLATSYIAIPIMFNHDFPRNIELTIHGIYALMSALVLAYSYLIIIVQCRQERNAQQKQKPYINLEKERGFRESPQRLALFSYCANATKDRIVDGIEFFSHRLWDNSKKHTELLKNFARHCVHPDDRSKVFDISRPSYFQEKLEHEPSHFLLLRLSPANMLEITNLPKKVRTQMKEAQKEWLWVVIHCTITKNHSTGDILVYISLANVDHHVLQENALRLAAMTDSLTGLFNRTALGQRIQEYFAKEDAVGAMFIIDLDNFKGINDTLGHPVGDQLLRETASLIQAEFRSDDILGRIGGDEFCIFAVGLKNPKVIHQKALKLNDHLWRLHAANAGEQLQISTSIGIALYPQHGENYETLYKNADIALYQAKRAGRNTYRIYSPEMMMGEYAEI